MKSNNAITNKEYWDNIHSDRNAHTLMSSHGYTWHIDHLIFELIKRYFVGGRLLEVGAGSSDWLINIAKHLDSDACVGLDYSEIGCDTLKKKSDLAKLSVEVVCADIFTPPERMIKSFDFILSFGVVEHFENLSKTLLAISAFAKPGGILFTLIPNMAGLNGELTKRWNREVYDLHVPHDLNSFIKGHKEAGLDVMYSSYLGSTNFGVISSCFKNEIGLKFWLYKQLTRFSKLIWLCEKHTTPFPATKLLAPYIVVVSRVPE